MENPGILVRAFEPEDATGVTEVMNQPLAIWGTLQVPYVSVEACRQQHLARKYASDLDRLA